MPEIRRKVTGGVQVTLDLPDGAPQPGVTLFFHPTTTDEFEAALGALGGLTAAADIERDYLSFGSALGQDAAHAMLYPPPGEAPARPPRSPFMESLRQRQASARQGLAPPALP